MRQVTVHCPVGIKLCRTPWLLAELGHDCQLRIHTRLPEDLLPDELIGIQSITGAAVIDADSELLLETPSAIQWLLARYAGGRLAPGIASPDYGRFLRLLHFGEGLPQLRDFESPANDGAGYHHWSLGWVSSLDQLLFAMLDHLDGVLADAPFMLGQAFSAADIQVTSFLKGIEPLGGLEDRDRLLSYLERMQQRPAYCSFVAKAAAARTRVTAGLQR